jgi:CheY-like chemotaxis protein
MADDNILKLGMSQEELEDTIQFSQQMVQELLELIGEAMADVERLRTENRALRASLEQAGLALPAAPAAAQPAPPAPQPVAAAGAPVMEDAPPAAEPASAPPVHAAAHSAPPAAPSASSAARDPRLGDGVLIVDDSRILQMRLRSLIEPLGVPIVGYAANGAEGVKQAMALNPRAMIMDFNMPVLNGLEAAKVLQRDAPQIRIIICAADLTAALSRELFQAGVAEILTKPIQLDHFVRSIKRCMDDRPLEPQ